MNFVSIFDKKLNSRYNYSSSRAASRAASRAVEQTTCYRAVEPRVSLRASRAAEPRIGSGAGSRPLERKFLFYYLFWCLKGLPQNRGSTYIAPTWSWASVHGEIHLERIRQKS